MKYIKVFFLVAEVCLVLCLIITKKTVVAIPLFIAGLISNGLEIWWMKRENKIDKNQLGRCSVILFFEFMLFLNYFVHFIDFLFE